MKFSPEIQDSIELRFSALARQMNQHGEDIISLGLGEPDFPTPPSVVNAAHQAMLDGMTRYSNPFGLFSLRQRIARKLRDDNDIDAQPEDILVAPGSKMALSLALGALLKPGDEIINLTPCYPSYIPQIKIAEPSAVIRNVDLLKQNGAPDIDGIEAALNAKTKAVLLNFPHNPTGRMLDAETFEALCALLADHDAFVISDEIYEYLNFSGMDHLSFGARADLAGRVITINGFSKAYSMTGWRIGYLHATDAAVMKRISRLQQHMNTNTAAFIQQAALAAMDLPRAYLDSYNANLAQNQQALEETAGRSNQLRVLPAQGGLFGFMDISATGMTSDGFATQLLEDQAVALTPGIVFGRNWEGFVRVSLAIEHSRFSEGMARLKKFVVAA